MKKSQSIKVVPVRELIAVQAERLNLRNADLARALGYDTPNVISMLKSGTMRLPFNKIGRAAEALKIDPLYLALCVDAENDFGMAALLQSISNRTVLTLNEEKQIAKQREIANGLDIDLDEYPQQFSEMLAAFAEAVRKEQISHNADLDRLANKARSAVKSARTREESKQKAA